MPEALDIHTDKKVYSIPEGLNELMYDISKEVLRCQPKNIYKFISDYLITLLKLREAVKVAVPTIEKEFQSAESQLNFLYKYNLTKEQGDRFATIIQAAYRGYRTRKRLLHLTDDIVKEELFRAESTSDQDATTDPVLSILKTRGVSVEETIEAATKIQAFYRGYKVRKMEQEKGIECLIREIPSHESWRHDWLNELTAKKTSGNEINRLRKEFADFHKHFSKQYEGDRLHVETIFGGKYEDYNWVCDQTSCQEFVIPTPAEARELAVPGELESSHSDLQDIPGARMMQEMVKAKIRGSLVSYEEADKERLFYEATSQKKSLSEGVSEEKTAIRVSQTTPSRTASQARSSRTQSIASTPRSEGSKSKSSRKSGSKASLKVEQTSAAPELSVRSLTEVDEAVEDTETPVQTAGADEQAISEVSDISAIGEEKLSQGSQRSHRTSKGSVGTADEKPEKLSQRSQKSGGSKASIKSSSKKSIAEVVEQPPEPVQEEPQAE